MLAWRLIMLPPLLGVGAGPAWSRRRAPDEPAPAAVSLFVAFVLYAGLFVLLVILNSTVEKTW